ncbi:hypothetical protein HK405_008799, partial [Cladochytrium tenue]
MPLLPCRRPPRIFAAAVAAAPVIARCRPLRLASSSSSPQRPPPPSKQASVRLGAIRLAPAGATPPHGLRRADKKAPPLTATGRIVQASKSAGYFSVILIGAGLFATALFFAGSSATEDWRAQRLFDEALAQVQASTEASFRAVASDAPRLHPGPSVASLHLTSSLALRGNGAPRLTSCNPSSRDSWARRSAGAACRATEARG